MISIRKKRQIRLFAVLFLLSVVFLSTTLIIGFYPFGLHKRKMLDVDMPRDALMYLSVKSVDQSIGRLANSVYAYRILHDDAFLELSLFINTLKIFLESTAKHEDAYIRLVSRYIYSRNASLLIWNTGINKDLKDSELYLMFDLGNLPSVLLNSVSYPESIQMLGVKYNISKSKYKQASLGALTDYNNNTFLVFSMHKGLLIVSKERRHLERIIDFINSKSTKLTGIDILQDKNEPSISDIALYMDNARYNSLSGTNTLLFSPLQMLSSSSKIYAYSKLYKSKVKLDIHTDYEFGGSPRALLYEGRAATNIAKMLSHQNTSLYFGFNAHVASLYPLLYADLKLQTNSKIANLISSSLTRLNLSYSLQENLKNVTGEVGIAYLTTSSESQSYPMLAFEVDNEAVAFTDFENSLLKQYTDVSKTERTYKNNFIYTYTFAGRSKLYHMQRNKILFFSEHEKAIQIFIDSLPDKTTLAKFSDKVIPSMKERNYFSKINFTNAINIIKDAGSEIKVWSYPYNMTLGSKISSNATHFQFVFDVDLKKN